MRDHAFHPEARIEFAEGICFYEEQRPGIGERLHGAGAEAILPACKYPNSGAPVRDGVRKLVTHGFPFVIYYEELAGEIVIWAVMHGSRKPDYWHHRRSPPFFP
jgi:plasmid stabilization system protein ParE